MRVNKVITLSPDRLVKVCELRVHQARSLIAQAKQFSGIEINQLLDEHFEALVAVVGDCVEILSGEKLGDLSVSEMVMVKDALLEVNAAFLALLGLELEPVPSPENKGTMAF